MTRTVLLATAALFTPSQALVSAPSVSPQDVVESLATALQKADAAGALDLFDSAAPGFAELKKNIEALAALPHTECTIAIVSTFQSGGSIQFLADWSLRTASTENGPQLEHRDRVSLSLKLVDKDWKIASLTPVDALAPPDPEVFALIARLAADLNDKNESGALGAFDKTMKQYGEIDNDIDALVTQNDVLCAIDIVSDVQTGDAHTLDLDWFFQIKSRADGGPTQNRRERVQVKLKKDGRRWRIFSMEPLKILSPEVTGS